MKYFVTGGAGFIGANYVEYLFNNVKNVSGITIYDNFTYAANQNNYQRYKHEKNFKVVRGDICEIRELMAAMKGHDFVIHFAAESHVDRSISSADAFIKTNIMGTYNVLEASKYNEIKRLIYVSTDEVYGSVLQGSSDELQQLKPNSPYAASKAAGDLLARSYFMTHGLDVRVTRSSNNYGKYQYPEKVIPVFIHSLLRGNKLPIYGNGINVREWIHVQDHCQGIQVALEHGSPGEIYNVGSEDHVSNTNLADKILDIMGFGLDMKSYVQDRKGHDMRYSINSEKLKKIGFTKKFDLNTGLRQTIEWYINNPTWFNSRL